MMASKKREKQKRNKLLISGLLSFLLAAISLGAGMYIGFMTLNYNYLTLGTLQNSIMVLFVCAGLFIALGVVSISVGVKLLSMAKSTNFVFYTKKSIIISSLVFYSGMTIVGIVAIAMCFATIIPSIYTIVTFVLSGLSIIICVACFIMLFKELRTFLNKIKKGEMTIQIEYPKRYVPSNTENVNMAYANKSFKSDAITLEDFSNEIIRLDEMKNKGLITDQEYQKLKELYIEKMNSKLL